MLKPFHLMGTKMMKTFPLNGDKNGETFPLNKDKNGEKPIPLMGTKMGENPYLFILMINVSHHIGSVPPPPSSLTPDMS